LKTERMMWESMMKGQDPRAAMRESMDPAKNLSEDGKFWSALGSAFIQPYQKAIDEGKPMEAAGRGAFEVASLLLGGAETKVGKALIQRAKGANTLNKTEKAATVANAASKPGEVVEATNILGNGIVAEEGVVAGGKAGAEALAKGPEAVKGGVEATSPKTKAGASAGNVLTQRESFWENWINKCFPEKNWGNTTFETLGKDYNTFKSANPTLDNEMRAMYDSDKNADKYLPSVVNSGSTNPVKIAARQGEKFYKLVQKRGNINSPSPYYLSKSEYNLIKANPLSSSSAEYDVFTITSKTNDNQLFQSTIAPTKQFANATPNTVYETTGGGKQSLIINNGDPDYWDKSVNPIETLTPNELPRIGK
jgi:hypothetical protein